MWEVFDCRDGAPILRVPFQWMARAASGIARKLSHSGWYDYAVEGDGW